MGSDAEHAAECAQKMEHAEAGFTRDRVETDAFVRVSVYP